MKKQKLEGTFWGRVDDVMEAKHLNLIDLASRSGIEYRRITMQRHRGSLPSVVDALAIAHVLGVPLDYLVSDSQPEPECSITKFRKYADIEADLLTMEKTCPDRIDLVRYFINRILGRPEVEQSTEGEVIKFPESGSRHIGNE